MKKYQSPYIKDVLENYIEECKALGAIIPDEEGLRGMETRLLKKEVCEYIDNENIFTGIEITTQIIDDVTDTVGFQMYQFAKAYELAKDRINECIAELITSAWRNDG